MSRRPILCAIAALLVIALPGCPGCDESGPAPDAGPTDEDAGPTDDDAGPTNDDAGPTDEDAGPTGEDAGPTGEDAGPTGEDAGPTGEDAGPTGEDAGPTSDDAGPLDAGDDAGDLPPDPATIAPADPPPSVYGSTRFLYEGADPVQRGVAPGTLEPVRASVIRGVVRARGGAPLPGARVEVRDHPELGYTLSRLDGGYDLVVNGGGSVVLKFSKAGHLPISRRHATRWGDWTVADDVVLLPRGPATAVALPPPAPVIARGAVESDVDGARQSTLLFGSDVTAELELADGTRVAAPTLHVRATEYTVGPDGPAAMPAPLPGTSSYTYCVELEADEAEAAGAVTVHFDPPLTHVVENFLDLPVGSSVPVGFYDRVREQWVASDNGRVVEILAINAGIADLDVDGDGSADTGAALLEVGLDAEDLTLLGDNYVAGDTLWVSSIPHFTPWDLNFMKPGVDPLPDPEPDPDPDPGSDCEKEGSTISCIAQRLGERIPIAGTDLALTYASDRVPGRAVRLRLPVSTRYPAALNAYLSVTTAGKRVVEELPVGDYVHTFTWDRRDAYGRVLDGGTRARVEFGYIFPLAMLRTPAADAPLFGRVPGEFDFLDVGLMYRVDRESQRTYLFRNLDLSLPVLQRAPGHLGGWSLDVLHRYDPLGQALHLGDGTTRHSEGNSRALWRVAGKDGGSYYPGSPSGTDALLAELGQLTGVAVAEDGVVWLAGETNNRILRIETDGTLSVVAGDPDVYGFAGDGGEAALAELDTPVGGALGPDGSFYFIDFANERIRRIFPDGTIDTVVGNGGPDPSPRVRTEGGDPRLEPLSPTYHLDVDQHGNLYYVDGARIRKLGTDGRAFTLAGNENSAASDPPDGVLATSVSLRLPWAVAAAPDGSVYFSSSRRIFRVDTEGVLAAVAGSGVGGCDPWIAPALDVAIGGVSALRVLDDGNLYFSSGCASLAHLKSDGTLVKVVDQLGPDPLYDGVHGRRARFASAVEMFAFHPRGDVLLTSSYNGQLWSARKLFPDITEGQALIASADGRETYLFDEHGRHLETREALTGGLRRAFGYDGAGRLLSITDGYGNVTSIERDADGAPLAIVGPGGHRTQLSTDANGWLSGVADPAGGLWSMSYVDGDGLLSSFTDPVGATSTFTWDEHGFLATITDEAGGGHSFVRDEGPGTVTVTRTSSESLVSTYEAVRLPDDAELRRHMDPAGGISEMLRESDGSFLHTWPDGSILDVSYRADPRFSMDAPLNTSVFTTPAGRVATLTQDRTVTLNAPDNLLDVNTWTEWIDVDGAVTTRTFTGSTRALEVAHPSGRTEQVTLNAQGDVVEVLPHPALSPVVHARDLSGQITSTTQGGRSISYGYATDRTMSSVQNPGGAVFQLGWDSAVRLSSITLPSSESFGFSVDGLGALSEVAHPGGAVHALSSTFHGRLASFSPAGGATHTWQYDLDRRRVGRTFASGAVEVHSYDALGRRAQRAIGAELISVGYLAGDASTRPETATRAGPSVMDHTTTFAWDGPFPEAADVSGAVNATVRYGYAPSSLTLSQIAVTGASTSAWDLVVDGERRIVDYGPLQLDRSGPAGRAARVDDAIGSAAYTFDSEGRVTTMTRVVNGVTVFAYTLGWGADGRVALRDETIGGDSWAFEHDDNGRLTRVLRDGVESEAYVLAPDGSRTSVAIDGAAPEAVTFAASGAPASRGALTWTFDADGFLSSRGLSGTAVYSRYGELLSTSDGVSSASYSYDFLGRRVARTMGGETTGYLYADPTEPFRVTHVVEPDGTLVGLLYDDAGYLFRIERAGVAYAVATDQVGTPRVIADASGAVVKSIVRDAFGNLISDSDPSFDAYLGFAGGLEDPVLGLVRFGLRDYDPLAGAFSAFDPALYGGGQMSLYVYVDGDPVTWRDPSGLVPLCVGAELLEIVGAGTQMCALDDGTLIWCVEVGFGIGAGFSVGFDAPQVGDSLNGSAGVDLGPITLGGSFTAGPCTDAGLGLSWNNGIDLGAGAKLTYMKCVALP